MRGFIKTFTIFIYFLLSLFVGSQDVSACENFSANTIQQYISSQKPETTLINNRKEEFYVIFQNRNRSEITNPSNKYNNFGFSGFNKVNINYDTVVGYTVDNNKFPIRISHSISPYLKNAIYTRAP